MPNDLVLVASSLPLVRACVRAAERLGCAASGEAGATPSADGGQLVLDLGAALAPPAAGRSKRRRAAAPGWSGTVRSADARSQSKLFEGLSPAPLVLDFHVAFGLPWAAMPGLADVPDELVQLRIALLEEEVAEFARAARARDLVGIADALADIAYVTYGAAVTFGIDLNAVVAEVHRSNMSKLDQDGRPVLRADGKVLKSSRYSPPEIAALLAAQARTHTRRSG